MIRGIGSHAQMTTANFEYIGMFSHRRPQHVTLAYKSPIRFLDDRLAAQPKDRLIAWPHLLLEDERLRQVPGCRITVLNIRHHGMVGHSVSLLEDIDLIIYAILNIMLWLSMLLLM